MAYYGFQYNVEEYLADSDSDLGDISDFEGFVEGVDFEAGHKVHADSLLDDSNWVEGDRTDAPVTFSFGRRPGLRVEVPDNPDILAIFELFFTVELVLILVMETNRYAQQFLAAKLPTLRLHSRFRKWRDTSVSEMYLFLAIIVNMGLVKLADMQDYWSTDDIISVPFFHGVMVRDRFLNILTFFHLVNNADLIIPRGEPGHDPLFKLGDPFKLLCSKFHGVYYPHKEISIDEGVIPWRGHIRFRTYNPAKPDKYGIKSYELCDSHNGYCCKYELYTGGDSTEPGQYGKIYDLMMRLLDGYFNAGHDLYCDNYYTSPTLFLHLFNRRMGATGTMRVRKGCPKALLKATLKNKGDKKVMNNGPLVAMKYKDRKDVVVLSSSFSTKDVDVGRIDRVSKQPIQHPECIHKYNAFMGGVDRSDQMVKYEGIRRRQIKWWKKVFFHLVSLTVSNACIVFNSLQRRPVRAHLLRRQLVALLVKKGADAICVQQRRGRPSAAGNISRLVGRHFPHKIKPTGAKQNLSRACVVCNPAERKMAREDGRGAKRKRAGRESSYECRQCSVTLCVDPCFEIYHTASDFTKAYIRWSRRREQGDGVQSSDSSSSSDAD